MKFLLTLLFAAISASCIVAQTPLGQADREYNSLAYLKASSLYENLLKKEELTEGEKLSAKAKLGFSYWQLKDSQSAERIFREKICPGSMFPVICILPRLWQVMANIRRRRKLMKSMVH